MTSTTPFASGVSTAFSALKPATPAIPNLAQLAGGGSATALLGASPMGMSQTTPAVAKPAVPQITPLSQVDTSGFTPGQLAAFNAAKALAPAPAAPAPAAPLSAPHVATTGGGMANPNTGSVTQPAVPNVSAFGSTGNAAPGAPAVPAVPGSGTVGSLDPSTNPLTSSPLQASALSAINSASQMTPEELQATLALNNLNSGYAAASANTQGQAIPMPFVTGQLAQLQRSQAAQAVPLQALITTQEAQRQMQLQGATTTLGAANTQLGTLAGLNTQTPLPFGSSTYSPATGAIGSNTVFGGSGSGGAATSSTMPAQGSAFDPNNAIDQMVQTYMNTGSMPSNIASMPQYAAAITQRANDLSVQQTGQPFNAAARGAAISTDTTSLGNLTTQRDQSNTSLQTVISNGQLLLSGLKAAGLNSSSIPAANAIQQAVSKGVIDPGNQAAFVNSLNTLQSEYAKMLMGTGVPTDQATSRAQAALPANLSASQLATVLDRMVNEGQNSISSMDTNIAAIQKRLTPYDFSTPASGGTNLGTGGSSGNPFSAASFFGT